MCGGTPQSKGEKLYAPKEGQKILNFILKFILNFILKLIYLHYLF